MSEAMMFDTFLDRLEDERDNRDLMSVGAGVSLRLAGLASLRVEHGKQLEAARRGAGKGDRVHASLLIAY